MKRHWHLIVRHVHPEWHGHCPPLDSRWPEHLDHRCDYPHWHFLWRHRHTETGR